MNFYVHDNYNQSTKKYIEDSSFMRYPANVAVMADTAPTDYTICTSFSVLIDLKDYVFGLYNATIDYLAFRTFFISLVEAQVGTDYATFGSLTAAEKLIALEWCNIRIAKELGLPTFYTHCGGADIGNGFIAAHLKNASSARLVRFTAAQTTFYNALQRTQGILVEAFMRTEGLKNAYIENGVIDVVADGIPGIKDYVMGVAPYATTGLYPELVAGNLIFAGDKLALCTSISSLLENGYA